MALSPPPDLLVIAASNGENLKLARRIAAQAEHQCHTAKVLDLTSLGLPLFTPVAKEAGMPDGVAPLHQQLMAATHWVICAPEYNGSIPPAFTSAVAWLSVQGDDFRSLFNGRPIAMASFSGGGGMGMSMSLRSQLSHLGAQVLGRQLMSNHAKPAKDESIRDLVHLLMQMQPLKL